MSNYMADVATNFFLVGNIMVKVLLGCTVSSSFSARFQLTNDRVAPVSNIMGTENPWV